MSLVVLTGPMFCGKSSTLVRYMDRAAAIHQPTVILSPHTDTRSSGELVCHTGMRRPVIKVSDLCSFLVDARFDGSQHVGIDEAQFFDADDLVEFCSTAVDRHGKYVVVAGLDTDFRRRPFGGVMRLAGIADKYEKLEALCSACSDGTPAIFTRRRDGSAGTRASPSGGGISTRPFAEHISSHSKKGLLAAGLEPAA